MIVIVIVPVLVLALMIVIVLVIVITIIIVLVRVLAIAMAITKARTIMIVIVVVIVIVGHGVASRHALREAGLERTDLKDRIDRERRGTHDRKQLHPTLRTWRPKQEEYVRGREGT